MATEAPPSYERAFADPLVQPPRPAHAGTSTTPIPRITVATLAQQVAQATSPNVSNVQDHLLLLKSFHQLQQTISNTSGLFGYNSTTSEIEREKRWAVYVVRAVDRFQAWWDTLPGEPLTASGLNERLKAFGGWFTYNKADAALLPHSQRGPSIEEVGGDGMALDADMLPPLDVIMVWYAVLQNPRNFLLDTIRHGKHEFWATDLPLKLIVSSPSLTRTLSHHPQLDGIDPQTLEHQPTDEAKQRFQKVTGLPYFNLDLPSTKRLDCPECSTPTSVPWTIPGVDTGYADPSFEHTCTQHGCGASITYDTLAAAVFRRDVLLIATTGSLLHSNFLDKHGRIAETNLSYPNSELMYPNRFFSCYSTQLLSLLTTYPNTDLSTVRAWVDQKYAAIEHRIKTMSSALNPSEEADINFTKYHSMASRSALNDVLHRYSRNPTPFSANPVGAVLKQTTFLNQILHNYPGPNGLEMVVRSTYPAFFELCAENKFATLIPTLSIDLVWQTHLLSPRGYWRYSTTRTQRFIAHDELATHGALLNAWLNTCALWDKKYRQAYNACSCDFCLGTVLFHRSSRTQKKHGRSLQQSSQSSTSHVSAHNVYAGPPGSYNQQVAALWKKICEGTDKVLVEKRGKERDLQEGMLGGVVDLEERFGVGREKGKAKAETPVDWGRVALGFVQVMVPVHD